jgi:hypothetical protein
MPSGPGAAENVPFRGGGPQADPYHRVLDSLKRVRHRDARAFAAGLPDHDGRAVITRIGDGARITASPLVQRARDLTVVRAVGTCLTWVRQCTQDDANFSNGIQRYLAEGDFDWAYWQLNGTQSDSLDHGSGKPRQHGTLDWYGLLNTAWNGPSDATDVERIKALEPATQHP